MALAILVFRGTFPNILMFPPYWWGSWELWACVTLSDINIIAVTEQETNNPIQGRRRRHKSPSNLSAAPLLPVPRQTGGPLGYSGWSLGRGGRKGCEAGGGFGPGFSDSVFFSFAGGSQTHLK